VTAPGKQDSNLRSGDAAADDWRYSMFVLVALMRDRGLTFESVAADLRRMRYPPRAAVQLVDDMLRVQEACRGEARSR
jgi:hypothetical protein